MFTVMVGVFSLLTSDYRQWSELHIHQWPHLNSSSIAMFCHVVTLHCCHYTSTLPHQQHYIAVTTQAHCLTSNTTLLSLHNHAASPATLHCCHYTSTLPHQQHYIAVTTQAHCLTSNATLLSLHKHTASPATLHCCHYTSILSHQQHYIAVTTQAHCLNHCTVAHRNSTSQADRVLSYVCVWGGASKTCDTQGPSLIVTHRNNQLWQYKLKTVDTWFSMQNMGLVGVHIALRTDVFPLLHSWSGKCYSSFCKVIGASFGNDLIHHYYQKKLMWLSRLCLACS